MKILSFPHHQYTFFRTVVTAGKKNQTLLVNKQWYYIILYYVLSCHVIYHIIYYIIYFYIYFAMSGRSHSYVAVHVGHQQIALEANTQKYKNFWVRLTNKRLIFLHIRVLRNGNCVSSYIRFTSTKSPSFSMIIFSALLRNCRVRLTQHMITAVT